MATDSLIGFVTGSLADPSYSDSAIGFVVGSLETPILSVDSPIGFVSSRLRDPHHPIGVMTPDGLVHVPLHVWDGEQLI